MIDNCPECNSEDLHYIYTGNENECTVVCKDCSHSWQELINEGI